MKPKLEVTVGLQTYTEFAILSENEPAVLSCARQESPSLAGGIKSDVSGWLRPSLRRLVHSVNSSARPTGENNEIHLPKRPRRRIDSLLSLQRASRARPWRLQHGSRGATPGLGWPGWSGAIHYLAIRRRH